MTDQYNALVVMLEKDMRDDDAQGLCEAIGRMRGVLSVSGHSHLNNLDSLVTRQRARREIMDALLTMARKYEGWADG